MFDASARSNKNKSSLNNILYSGPCLLRLIEDILLRFRVLFGLTCSPFLLNDIVKVHVEKHVNYDTRAGFIEILEGSIRR